MVRKTTAVEINKNETKTQEKKESAANIKSEINNDDIGINFEKLLNDTRKGAKENSHLLIGVVFLLRGLITLRAFLLGMILITSGILFISGFFKK